MDAIKPDCLQVLSDRLQQLSDISSRFDALTKETDEKLHNVTKTANVLQNKMTPVNEQMESLRHRRKAFESCKLFLEQTSSYQATTEKYIKDIHQTKINSVEDYVHSLSKAKESLDFFSTFLPQEKTANNLHQIVRDGSKNLVNKFKEIVVGLTDSERFSPEKCTSLANAEPGDVASYLPTFDKKLADELCVIAGWLDKENMSSVYLQSYAEVRSLALYSAMKKLRDSMLGVTRFPFKVDQPQELADQLVTKAKDFLVEDMRKFTLSVRREFKQDPESLLRLVSVLDRLRQLRQEMAAALAPCSPHVRSKLEDVAKEMRSQAHSSLEDYRDDIVKDSGMQVRPLPADGTVHELTLQALKFLQQLHEYELTTYEVLERDSAADGDRKRRSRVIGGYLSQTLANLLRTLDTRSEQYTDPVLRSIFLLNNYRYVHQRLKSCEARGEALAARPARAGRSSSCVTSSSSSSSSSAARATGIRRRENMTSTMETFNCDASRFFEENQLKHRDNYLNKGWARVLEIVMEKNKPLSQHRMASELSGKLSDKEKALIKEKFKSFNEEFMAAYKTQSNYSVPDSELRQELIRENKDFLLEKYTMFREKYSNVPFTSKKDKYIKFSRDDVERMLEDFFRGE